MLFQKQKQPLQAKWAKFLLLALLTIGPVIALSEDASIYASPTGDKVAATSVKIAKDDLGHKYHRRLQEAKVRSILQHAITSFTAAEEQQLVETIIGVSQEYQIDPLMITAIIEIESQFDVYARSYMGARGLMQVMPETGAAVASELGIDWQGAKTLYDPLVNIRIGTYYFASLLNIYNDPYTALVAYNRGPSNLNYYLRQGYQLPQRYSRKVMRALQKQSTLLPTFA